MYIILLKFGANKAKAGDFMEGHKAWIKQGFDDGVFVMVGSLKPNAGGGLLATGASRAEIEARVAADPFVEEGIVEAEILEIDPARADERLAQADRPVIHLRRALEPAFDHQRQLHGIDS